MDEGPTCLVIQNGDNFEVSNEGAMLLAGLQPPIAVVSVCGLYRTGKSYLLNRLARKRGFRVGSTTESCTRGIWVWRTGIRADGTTLLLMDTEGMASMDQDESYDAKIFSLGLLLSSIFAFNSMGVIDEAAIDRLFLVSELTKLICASSNLLPSTPGRDIGPDGSGATSEIDTQERALAEIFPPFVWILRDFVLDMRADGRQLSADEYLEIAIAERRPGGSTEGGKDGVRRIPSQQRRAEERNRIRRSIRTLFPSRRCFALVRPAVDESVMRSLSCGASNDDNVQNDCHTSAGGESELDNARPEFVAQVEAVRVCLLDGAPIKTLFGQALGGAALLALARTYIAAVNAGTVPAIRSAWEGVLSDAAAAALRQAVAAHAADIRALLAEVPVPHKKRFREGTAAAAARAYRVFSAAVATVAVPVGSGGGGEGGTPQQPMQSRGAPAAMTTAAAREAGPAVASSAEELRASLRSATKVAAAELRAVSARLASAELRELSDELLRPMIAAAADASTAVSSAAASVLFVSPATEAGAGASPGASTSSRAASAPLALPYPLLFAEMQFGHSLARLLRRFHSRQCTEGRRGRGGLQSVRRRLLLRFLCTAPLAAVSGDHVATSTMEAAAAAAAAALGGGEDCGCVESVSGFKAEKDGDGHEGGGACAGRDSYSDGDSDSCGGCCCGGCTSPGGSCAELSVEGPACTDEDGTNSRNILHCNALVTAAKEELGADGCMPALLQQLGGRAARGRAEAWAAMGRLWRSRLAAADAELLQSRASIDALRAEARLAAAAAAEFRAAADEAASEVRRSRDAAEAAAGRWEAEAAAVRAAAVLDAAAAAAAASAGALELERERHSAALQAASWEKERHAARSAAEAAAARSEAAAVAAAEAAAVAAAEGRERELVLRTELLERAASNAAAQEAAKRSENFLRARVVELEVEAANEVERRKRVEAELSQFKDAVLTQHAVLVRAAALARTAEARAQAEALEATVSEVVSGLVYQVERIAALSSAERAKEEKEALSQRLAELMFKISSLPVLVQNRLFCSPTNMGVFEGSSAAGLADGIMTRDTGSSNSVAEVVVKAAVGANVPVAIEPSSGLSALALLLTPGPGEDGSALRDPGAAAAERERSKAELWREMERQLSVGVNRDGCDSEPDSSMKKCSDGVLSASFRPKGPKESLFGRVISSWW